MANLAITATFAGGGGGGNLTIPASTYDVWDFDDTAVSWDTDVTASTQSALNSAIQTAMALGTTASPQYHRITWTGGDIAGDLTLSVTSSLPDKYGPHILIQGGDYTVVSGEVNIGTDVSNIKFRGFRFQPTSTDFSGGKAMCLRPGAVGGGRRFAAEGCQFGAYWRSGAASTYPEGIGGSYVSGWEITLKDNECRSMFQLLDARAGWYDFEQNFVTGLIDDFMALTVRGVVGPDGNRRTFARMVGNVILDHEDDVTYSGYHCDMFQCGTPSDATGDEYVVQRFGNVYIGDTYQQYPTMNCIVQQNNGGATRFEIDSRDNVILCTGTRGMWLPDRRFRLERDLMGWPPLAGPVPSTGTGWNGGPFRQHLRSSGGSFGTNPDIVVDNYLAPTNFQDNASWGATGIDPVILADPTASLGGATAYDTVFPNMTGLTYSNGQVRIPVYTGARTKAAVRSYIATQYEPYSAANGTGWTANGFDGDPANWF